MSHRSKFDWKSFTPEILAIYTILGWILLSILFTIFPGEQIPKSTSNDGCFEIEGGRYGEHSATICPEDYYGESPESNYEDEYKDEYYDDTPTN